MLDAFAELTEGAPIHTLVNTHSDADHVVREPAARGRGHRLVEAKRRADPPPGPRLAQGIQRLAHGMRVVGRLPLPVVGSLPLPVLPRIRLRAIGTYIGDMLAPFDFDGHRDRARPRASSRASSASTWAGASCGCSRSGPRIRPGDLLIHVPDAGVVYTGDILFIGGTPIMWAGPVTNWIDAIDKLLGLEADTYVPGHGPVCGREEAEAVKRYWVWLEAPHGTASAWACRRGRPRATSPCRRNSRRYAWSKWSAPERIVVNVHTLERERRGQLGGEPSARELVTLFSRVALLGRNELTSPRRPT